MNTSHASNGKKDRHHPIGLQQRVAAHSAVNDFLRSSTSNRVLGAVSFGLDPLKEITESWVAWDVLRSRLRFTGWSLGDRTRTVLVVGDGRYPRTGTIIASNSAWHVTSVDPLMRQVGAHPSIPHLTGLAAELRIADDGRPEFRQGAARVYAPQYDVVVAVHSHASVESVRAVCKPGGILITIPCCYPWPLDRGEHWPDDRILSPDRLVIVERGA